MTSATRRAIIAALAAARTATMARYVGNVMGHCAEVSEDAADRLSAEGIQVRVVDGCVELDRPVPRWFGARVHGELARFVNHTWLEADGWLFDGTAAQFNGDLLTPMPAILAIRRADAVKHLERAAPAD